MLSAQDRLARAQEAASKPLPRTMSLNQLIDEWSIMMGGINALGGWLIAGPNWQSGRMSNPRVFSDPEGQRLRHRFLKIEQRIIVVRRGDRPRGPCPTCKLPYDYELLPDEIAWNKNADCCGGCKVACPVCGLPHKRRNNDDSDRECVKALSKKVLELSARLDGK